MKAAPRSVRRLWTALSALLVLGVAAYVRFLLTGSYDLFIALFNTVGAAFFILVIGFAAGMAILARQASKQRDTANAERARAEQVRLGAQHAGIGRAAVA